MTVASVDAYGEEFVRPQRAPSNPPKTSAAPRRRLPRGLHAPRHGGVRADGAPETSTRPRHVVEVQDGDVAEDAGSASAAEDEKFAPGGRVRAGRGDGGGGVHLSRRRGLSADGGSNPSLGAFFEVENVDVAHGALLGARTAVNDEEASVLGGARDVRVARGRAGAGDGETAPLPGFAVEHDDVVETRAALGALAAEDVHLTPDGGGGGAGSGGKARAASRGGGLAHPPAGAVGGEAEDPEVVERAGDLSAPPMNRHISPTTAAAHPPRPGGGAGRAGLTQTIDRGARGSTRARG